MLEGPRIEMHSRRPAPALRGLVDGYTDYLLERVPAGIHRGLPSRHLTMVIPLDAPLQMAAMPDPDQPVGSFDVVVSGLHRQPAQIRMTGRSAGVQLTLTPAGCRALLGLPAGELGSWVGSLVDVLGPRAVRLRDRLVAAATPRQRFAVLDEELLGLLGLFPLRRDVVRPEVGWAWRRLVRGVGAIAVGELAAEVGWSRRHLAEQFRREYGLAPKAAARVLRFERSAGLLASRPAPRLGDVAAICGYADQAHLARDWRELAGCAPSRWLAEEAAYRDTVS
ncbi:MAG TPA: helix-turn-helix domain-containing protein [Nocardioidaceae bacterium]|nr:helix-turn-helix domain-containing protein [Nocardioidaceae bacterium]